MRPRSACPGSVAPAAPCAQAGPCRAVPCPGGAALRAPCGGSSPFPPVAGVSGGGQSRGTKGPQRGAGLSVPPRLLSLPHGTASRRGTGRSPGPRGSRPALPLHRPARSLRCSRGSLPFPGDPGVVPVFLRPGLPAAQPGSVAAGPPGPRLPPPLVGARWGRSPSSLPCHRGSVPNSLAPGFPLLPSSPLSCPPPRRLCSCTKGFHLLWPLIRTKKLGRKVRAESPSSGIYFKKQNTMSACKNLLIFLRCLFF